MSTLETLHKVVDDLPEEARLDLIQYIAIKYDDFLPPLSAEEMAEYDGALGKLLTQRYEHYKRHPETAIPAEESRRRINAKYGWK